MCHAVVLSAFLSGSRGISVSRLSLPKYYVRLWLVRSFRNAFSGATPPNRYFFYAWSQYVCHFGFRPPLTAVICYLNQAIIPICTVATLIYPPLLTTIRGAYFPRLTKSRWGMPARRTPDRLAALLTAFRLVYRVLPAPDFHRRERPQSTCTRPIFILPTCQSRHTSS